MKIRDLIDVLKGKEQDDEVEFFVLSADGAIVCMDIRAKAVDMIGVLRNFPGGQEAARKRK